MLVLTRQLLNSQIYFCFLVSFIPDTEAKKREYFKFQRHILFLSGNLALSNLFPLTTAQAPSGTALSAARSSSLNSNKTQKYCTTFPQPKVILIPAKSQD